MKEIGKVAAAIVGGVILILGVIMAAAWLALAFVAPIRWPLWHRSLD